MKTHSHGVKGDFEAFQSALVELSDLPRRVQVRQLLPMVEGLIRHGFPIMELANTLTAAGIEFKPTSLKQAVYLWRKRQSAVGAESSDLKGTSPATAPTDKSMLATNAASAGGQQSHTSHSYRERQTGTLTRKHLREMRDDHIDLEDLAKKGRVVTN